MNGRGLNLDLGYFGVELSLRPSAVTVISVIRLPL